MFRAGPFSRNGKTLLMETGPHSERLCPQQGGEERNKFESLLLLVSSPPERSKGDRKGREGSFHTLLKRWELRLFQLSWLWLRTPRASSVFWVDFCHPPVGVTLLPPAPFPEQDKFEFCFSLKAFGFLCLH